ncbi:MAG: hypothetical protein DRJ42_17425 [Deltaproteobacteria bacterium]|nr:MAG: hypothetical protein DRJ42_17425 [Deltaproteobacteria bacterium]
MRVHLGIDVGSTTVKVVVLAPGGEEVHRRCERHRGRADEVLDRLLFEVRARHDISTTGVTGAIGAHLAPKLGAVPVHEVHAVVLATRELEESPRTIVELGGQDAKLVLLGTGTGADDMQMNDRCAAGTGATIDRIAHRLGLDSPQLASCGLTGDLSVAAKCGVFAETDVVNLVKGGASWSDAMSALARAIVVQNLAVLARGRLLRPPVLLLGGPHAHLPFLAAAWRELLGELWIERGVSPGPVVVPEGAELFAARGAALHAAHGGRPLARVSGVIGGERSAGPLMPDRARRPDLDALRPAAPKAALRGGPVKVHIGVDSGSTTAKVVLLDEAGEPLAQSYGVSEQNPVLDVRARLLDIDREAASVGAVLEVLSVGVTGYGAELVGPAIGADVRPVETVAHAAAAASAMPGVEVVVDVGGTDVKVMCLDGEEVTSFHVSNQCSAGHGAFLAAAAEDLAVPLGEYAEHAFRAERAPRFTVGCSVFMDTDRVTFQRDGYTTEEILAGLARALPHNVWEFIVPEPPERLGRRFLLTGGAQRNLASAWAHALYLRERVPGADVQVHPQPGLAGAIGAALIARRHHRSTGAPSGFVGMGRLADVKVEVRRDETTRCTRCELECERSIVELERPPRPSASLVVGNTCERGADVSASKKRSARHAPDLLAEEASRLFRPLLPPPPRSPSSFGPPSTSASRVVIGIPRVMGLYRSAPLLLHYLRAVGVPDENVVLSPPTSSSLFQKGARWGVTDPCFPSKLVLSHVDWLLRSHRERPLDALLMPTLTHAAIAVRGTADTASCPLVAASGQTSVAALRRDGDTLGDLGIRALTPELTLVDRPRLEGQLLEAFGELLGMGSDDNARALDYALAAQRAFHERTRRRGAKVIRRAVSEGRAVAVVLARPYHADPGVSHGISTELASRGVPVLGISSLPIDDASLLDLGSVLPLATNSGCAEKVWAARLIERTPNLVAVDVSSFRCGQDASILGLLTDILGRPHKPVLRMHDLDEDRPGATFRLRIETFLDGLRRYERRALGVGGRSEVVSVQPRSVL